MKKIIEVNANNFEKEITQSTIPVLVDFWAEWCPPCRAIAPVIDEIAEEQSGLVKVAKVDVDENADLAKRFGIKSIPTLIIFDSGIVQSQLHGIVPKQAILNKLDELIHQTARA